MAFAINLLALLLVLAITWIGVLWMSGRVHGHGRSNDEVDIEPSVVPGRTPTRPRSTAGRIRTEPCPKCNGSGAARALGRITPCPICEGTGEAAALD